MKPEETRRLEEIKINWFEISHHMVEKVEKQRYKIMALDIDEEQKIQKWKDFVFTELQTQGAERETKL